jgi:hypothetical protein
MKITACISPTMTVMAPSLACGQDHPEQLYKAEVIVAGKGEKEYARGFREGLNFDAFAAWLRRDKDAPNCGLPTKF